MPDRSLVKDQLEKALTGYIKGERKIDTITFAGNGEPTMHPEFSGIIEDTIHLREKYSPHSAIAVLSNATLVNKANIRQALMKVEYNILKLDSVNEETIQKINCPLGHFSLKQAINSFKTFSQNLTIQTLFVKGYFNNYQFDNSTDEEVDAWLKVLRILQPKLVMIYTIARDTPVNTVYKVDRDKLNMIAKRVEQLGIPVSISS